jgi:hypothetical protein
VPLSYAGSVLFLASALPRCENQPRPGLVGENTTNQEPSSAGVADGGPGLHRSQTFLGEHFRRLKARRGAPKAITAVAHKLARIISHLITTQQDYDVTVFQENERRAQERKRNRLYVQAKELGFQLVPLKVLP